MSTSILHYDNYSFTSNLTNYACPGVDRIGCIPPNACARDPRSGSQYCCDAAAKNVPGRVCWSIGRTCANDGSTINCGVSPKSWCCSKYDICTKNVGQTNNCWNTLHNEIQDIDRLVLNDTYSSLSSKKPWSTFWSFDPATLLAATETSSKPSSPSISSPSVSVTGESSKPSITDTLSSRIDVTPNTSPTSPPGSSTRTLGSVTPTISRTPPPGPSAGISGGAIGGIVVTAVVFITIVAAFGIYYSRKRNTQKVQTLGEYVSKYNNGEKVELSAETPPQELGNDYTVAELEANK